MSGHQYPRYRMGEVVRVLRANDLDPGDLDPTGSEGTVTAFSPTRRGTASSIAVWLPGPEEVWSFDEDNLESLGMVEVDGDGDEPQRVPVDPETHLASFGGDLSVRLITEVGEADAPRFAAEAEASLRRLIDIAGATWKGEVHWHPPYRYDLDLDIRTRDDSRAAFEALVASRKSGWTRRVDDGWSAEFWWSAKDDESQTPFLVVEASDVGLFLTPLSSPATRPVKPDGRTHDPGLPGFTPPEPEFGYEPDEL